MIRLYTEAEIQTESPPNAVVSFYLARISFPFARRQDLASKKTFELGRGARCFLYVLVPLAIFIRFFPVLFRGGKEKEEEEVEESRNSTDDFARNSQRRFLGRKDSLRDERL